MTNKTKKTDAPVRKKVRISDLQPTYKRLELIHPNPEYDLEGAWVELCPRAASLDYMLTAMEIQNIDVDQLNARERLALLTKLTASCMTGWDEDSFGGPFSVEAAADLMQEAPNLWIRDVVEASLSEESDFFKTA